MTQEERWNIRYQELKSFIETNKRNPSKHRIEEHDMLNWVKANRKALNAGKMKPERAQQFEKLDKTEHVPPLKTVKSVQFWS